MQSPSQPHMRLAVVHGAYLVEIGVALDGMRQPFDLPAKLRDDVLLLAAALALLGIYDGSNGAKSFGHGLS